MARFKGATLAPRTVSSYASDERVYRAWCLAADCAALPATEATVQLYVTDLIGRGRTIATAVRHVVAIQRMHKMAGQATPCGAELRILLSGARRILCQQPVRKEALRLVDLRAMLRVTGAGTAIAARNTALLLFGFASALRRSSLAGLRFEDLEFRPEGVLVTVKREKQDREGKGRILAVPRGKRLATCPVRALDRWIVWRGTEPGFLFQRVLNGKSAGKGILPGRVCQIVQEAVAAIGLDRNRYGAHSLRAGMASEALELGVNEVMVARQLGHSSLETTRIYLRSRDLFRGNASSLVGL